MNYPGLILDICWLSYGDATTYGYIFGICMIPRLAELSEAWLLLRSEISLARIEIFYVGFF